MTTPICPACGATWHEGAMRCWRCDGPCRNCGAALALKAEVCWRCLAPTTGMIGVRKPQSAMTGWAIAIAVVLAFFGWQILAVGCMLVGR